MNRKRPAFKKTLKDRSFVLTVLAFLIFGIVIIADSTIIHSNSLYSDPYRFVILQVGWVLIGLVGFFFFYNFNYQKLDKPANVFFVITLALLALLALVSLFPCNSAIFFAPCVNGANRWFYLNASPLPKLPLLGVVGFQPGEMAKLSLLIYLSVTIPKQLEKGKDAFKIFLIPTALVSGLILAQPNMSTATVVFLIGLAIYFASGASLKPLFKLAPFFIILATAGILLSPYRRERLLTQIRGSSDSTDREQGYHIKQVQIALGSGGLLGVGFGQSRQKYYYLPEVASDSIFAIIGEEFGFIGTTIVIIAFGYLIYRGFNIAFKSESLRGRLLAVGITSWLGIQFFVNVAAMTQIIPLTGVPIPLISYGGSSMVFSLMGLGILANIGKESQT